MNNEKRSLLAISLSALIFVIYYAFFFKPPTPSPTNVSSSNVTKSQNNTETKQTNLNSSTDPKTADVSISVPTQLSLLKTSLYEVEHSSLGGAIKKFFLQKYHEGVEKNSPFVNLFASPTPENFLLTFHQSNFVLPSILPFEVTRESSNQIEYQWKNNQLEVIEKIEWNPDNYVANVRVEIKNLSNQVLETAIGFKLETPQNPEKKDNFSFLRGQQNLKYPAFYGEKGVTRFQNLKNLAAKTEQTGPAQWIGLEDRYFLWAIISRTLSAEEQIQYGFKEGNILYSELIYPKEMISPSSTLEKEFTIYAGPKEIDLLKAANAHLEDAVDYGWFSIVAHPILFLLKFFHRWVGNWGVAIILLTLFIKLILHPINKKTMDSMKSMQKLQPRLAELREKFKNDRERLNVEMMSLFKTHKVNPMGGCLPMILQMPVYIALYKVLYNAIELYHAPFFAFYKDLSAPDPYFILPILLGIFMVIQQKMTPSAAQDPAQAKAMLMMPIVFSAFMLFLPVGLVIYIFVNTSTTVIQQYLHKHDLGFTDLIRRKKKSS